MAKLLVAPERVGPMPGKTGGWREAELHCKAEAGRPAFCTWF